MEYMKILELQCNYLIISQDKFEGIARIINVVLENQGLGQDNC